MIVLLQADKLCGENPRDQATMDCIWVAFYYLLRPGWYDNASGDVSILLGDMHIKHAHLATLAQLQTANFTSLTFTTQKNGVKGKKLSRASNSQTFACYLTWCSSYCIRCPSQHSNPCLLWQIRTPTCGFVRHDRNSPPRGSPYHTRACLCLSTKYHRSLSLSQKHNGSPYWRRRSR